MAVFVSPGVVSSYGALLYGNERQWNKMRISPVAAAEIYGIFKKAHKNYIWSIFHARSGLYPPAWSRPSTRAQDA